MVSFSQIFKRRKRTGAVRIVNGIKEGNPIFAWLLILPAFATWLVFWLYVNLDSLVLAFTGKEGTFSFENFAGVIKGLGLAGSGEALLWTALKNTLTYFFVNYFVVNTFNVVFAYFVYKKIAGYKYFRFVLYLPNLLAGAVLTTIYKELLHPQFGLVNTLFELGLLDRRYQFLASDIYAMPFSVVYSLWVGVGATFIYSMGAMSRIPKDMLEAGQLDGIGPGKEFLYLVLPMISGTLSTLYVIGFAGILSAGGATLYLTGLNRSSCYTLSFWIFTNVYSGNANVGGSSALGLLMTAFTFPLTMFVKWLANKIQPEVTF